MLLVNWWRWLWKMCVGLWHYGLFPSTCVCEASQNKTQTQATNLAIEWLLCEHWKQTVEVIHACPQTGRRENKAWGCVALCLFPWATGATQCSFVNGEMSKCSMRNCWCNESTFRWICKRVTAVRTILHFAYVCLSICFLSDGFAKCAEHCLYLSRKQSAVPDISWG